MADNNLKPDFYTDIAVVLQQYKDVGEASSNAYDTLLRTLADPEVEACIAIKILKDLEYCVSLLNKDYQALVQVIMSMKWLDKGPELTAVYHAFVLNLVSAHMFYLKPCLRMLVKKFIPESVKNAGLEDFSEDRVKIEQDFFSVHDLLKSISRLVPMTSVLIVQILEDMFPYLNKGVSQFEHYTRSVLAVSTYIPSLRLEILELVTENMLKLDVRSSRVDITSAICVAEGETEEQEEMEDTMFEIEDAGGVDTQKIKPEPVEDRLAAILPLAGSLDAMMSLTFQYIRDQCYVQGKLDWEVTKRLYRELLSIFDKFIFPTHACCHVQFLLFYICSFKEALADGFIDYLWKKVTNPTEQCVYRQNASCFIGSFLTRAKYIPTNTAKAVMNLMMQWIHKYLDNTSDQGLNPDLAHHGPFYAVCQSAFYIFCFRHNDFAQAKTGHKWAESLNFQRVITSKLNPLRVCMPIIVKTFASATRMHQLAFCDTIIERNNRYSLPVTTSVYAVEGPHKKQLDYFFPFDPYLLPRSCSYIVPLYREFHGSLPDDDGEEDEDEDDFLPDEDVETSQATYSISMSLGKSPVDFLHYGTSPGFKHA